jgi:hypothetical protein
MKRFFLIALMAIAAVALVTAPGWAAGARMLSDRQLDNVHAGASADADADAYADTSASAKARTDIDAESSAKARTSGVAKSKLAVDIDNKCAAKECELEVKNANGNTGGGTSDNAQSIANTVASVNAVQINVANGGGSFQSNIAYSAQGAVSEVDSAEFATGTAALFGHADGAASSASHATSANASGSGNSTATGSTAGSTPVALASASGSGNQDATATTNQNTSAKAKSDADAAAASAASSASSSASSSATSGGAVTSSTASSALAAYSPKVQVKNRCAAKECELEVRSANGNTGGSTGTNAQSILNTVVSVNAVQMNVANGAASQSNVAFSSIR